MWFFKSVIFSFIFFLSSLFLFYLTFLFFFLFFFFCYTITFIKKMTEVSLEHTLNILSFILVITFFIQKKDYSCTTTSLIACLSNHLLKNSFCHILFTWDLIFFSNDNTYIQYVLYNFNLNKIHPVIREKNIVVFILFG